MRSFIATVLFLTTAFNDVIQITSHFDDIKNLTNSYLTCKKLEYEIEFSSMHDKYNEFKTYIIYNSQYQNLYYVSLTLNI